jgi:hypothetical protein
MRRHSRFILLDKYCQNDLIKNDVIDRECSTCEREEERIQNFYGKKRMKEKAGKIKA